MNRGLRVVATIAAATLLLWVLAQAAWRLATPAPAPRLVPAPPQPAAAILASGLWSGSGAPASATSAAPAVAESFTLLGVMAERGGGYALARTRSGARVVVPGDEIAAGVTLVAVDAHGVRVRDSGGERTVELRRAPPPPAAPAGVAPPVRTAAVSAPRPVPAGCAVPVGFRGPVLKVHAELVEGFVAQPDSWRALLAPDDGALVVRDEGGFATLLGLAKGDRLAVANGVALRQTDDLVAAVLRPLIANQAVRIGGQRGGQGREMLLLNASACP